MKKSVFGGTGGGNRLVYKGRDDYFFTYFRFYTVMISDGRNNWQKKNDCLFSELASGGIRHGGQQGYDINSIANCHNTQRRRDYTGRYVTCQHVTVAAALKLRLEILRMKPLQLEAVKYNLSPTKFESLYPLPLATFLLPARLCLSVSTVDIVRSIFPSLPPRPASHPACQGPV